MSPRKKMKTRTTRMKKFPPNPTRKHSAISFYPTSQMISRTSHQPPKMPMKTMKTTRKGRECERVS